MSLFRLLSRQSFAAHQVFSARHRLQVSRINARAVTAKVVNFQPSWYFLSTEHDKRKDVGAHEPNAIPKLPVPRNFVNVGQPMPTPTIAVDVHFAHKATNWLFFHG
jgi:hypothetical protein